MSPAADSSAARLKVIAVVVAHDGASWLPRLLAALSTSSRSPDELIGVDTGSVDGSLDLLQRELGAANVVEVGPRTGFGAAIGAGLAADAAVTPSSGRHAAQGRVEEWVWLLHDDCAPVADTLDRLLAVAAADPGVAVVGCRIRSWPSSRRLLEVGVTITGTGHRETGLEPGERDQGQLADERDVLAVSSAGMLVRRSVWDELGGFDPQLPLFRDDVDFGWRASVSGHRVVVAADAVLFHVEAASRGVRDIASTSGRPHRADRRAALYTVLANCRPAAFPILYVRLLLGSVLRSAGYLLGKLPGAAWDELAAGTSVLGRPWRLLSARATRRRARRGPAASVRRLLPPWWAPYANGLDLVMARFGGTVQAATAAAGAARRRAGRTDPTALETGPVPEEAVNLPVGDGFRASLARHPLLAVVVVLSLLSLAASRGLWGAGFLQGGALLPAPDGAGDWWRLYAQPYHAVALGSGLDTAPYVALLALPATLLLGKAWLVVDLVMLFAAPLAAIGGWFAAARLVRGLGARVWMSASYGLVPILTGAVTTGHLGTVVFAIMLPWVLRSGCRLVDLDTDPRWESAWATGLMLSIATAFAPVGWPMAVAVCVVTAIWLVTEQRWVRIGQLALALLLPVILLLPWSWRVLTHAGLALTEAGAVDVPGASITGSAWQLALGRVGAVGDAPWWLGAGLTFLALVALLRRDTRARVAGAWLLIAVGLGSAAVMWREPVSLPLGAGQAYAWLGVPVVVASAGAIGAAGLAGDGLRAFIRSGAFGWRQPIAVVAVLVALVGPLLSLGWWVGAAPDGDLHRGVAIEVPAYMIDGMETTGKRVLVLHTEGPQVRYAVLAGDGERLGDDSVLPPRFDPALTSLVASMLSESHPSDVERLAALGIGYVVLPSASGGSGTGGASDLPAVAELDALAGLTRTSTNESVLTGWQVHAASAAPVTASGDHRNVWLVAQALMWGAVIVLAAPGVRRRPLPAVSP